MTAELRKYGVGTTVVFPLFAAGTNDFKTDAAHASGDTVISKDEGTEANTTNGFVDEGRSYSLALTATEMEAARIVITIIDQGTKAYDDQCIVIETYGHASAQHPFDLGTASTAQTGDAYARLGAPAGASVSADVAAVKTQTAAIETDTQDIQTRLPAALVSGRMDSSVGAMAANVMTAAAAASDLTTELQSGLATASALSTVAGYIDTEIAAIKAKTDNLPASPAATGDIPSATTIAGAVWDEAFAGHLTGDTFGNLLTSLPDAATTAYEVWQADPAGWSAAAGTFGKLLIDAETDAGLIKIVTDKLDNTLELDTSIYRFTANALEQAPTGSGGGLDAAGVRAAIGLASANLDTQLGAIDTVVDSILVDTAEIGAAGAGLTALASASNLSTLAGYVDTEVAAIKAKTDNLPASPAATGDIPSAASNASAVRTELTTELGRLDAAVSTRSTLDAAGVRTAVGLSSANLDTQFGALPTATEIADETLDRDLAAGADTNARSLRNAVRFLRNKWSLSGTTLTVTKEDDTTAAWTASVSTDPSADPVTGSDPT